MFLCMSKKPLNIYMYHLAIKLLHFNFVLPLFHYYKSSIGFLIFLMTTSSRDFNVVFICFIVGPSHISRQTWKEDKSLL